MKVSRNFTAGRMNKSTSEKLIPNGEYIDALNVRIVNNSENSDGLVENVLGNTQLTVLRYTDGTELSSQAVTVGKYADDTNEVIYWMVHDPAFSVGATGKLDMIVSFNQNTNILTYHVISIDDGGGVNTTLNLSPLKLINAVNKIDNLLFFTDDYNPPRKIDVRKKYAMPTANVDAPILYEDLLVIKKPPVSPPDISFITTNTDSNYMSDRFLCFAYRYRYENGEYSATSPFTNPVFLPGPFNFSYDTLLNEGMKNRANAVKIYYNTGSSLVKNIELLFKDSDSNTIKVIEKINKEDLNVLDDSVAEYVFANNKIFTILPDSELLRLYDNVPRLAEAQTLMGNRLMYGGYVDGYDLTDVNGSPVNIEFEAKLVSEEISTDVVSRAIEDGLYSLFGSEIVNDSVLMFDLTGFDLSVGYTIQISIQFTHGEFSGGNITPTSQTGITQLLFTYTLQNDYNSVYELATSDEFISAIGSSTNIQPVDDSCNGFTLTDRMNCEIPESLNSSSGLLYKYDSGVFGLNKPINIIASPYNNEIRLQLVGMRFVDDPTGAAILYTAYEYYSILSANVWISKTLSPLSLHSNRSYEIGMVYVDEYGRMSLPQVSPLNTISIPCKNARDKNTIDVTIPIDQKPPAWATHYKFVIKADKEGYETIFSNIFFKDSITGYVYCLLEGESARKVQEGDILYIKRDTDGPLSVCAETVVLEKKSQGEDFISVDNTTVPAGVYMKLNPNNFSVEYDSTKVIDGGNVIKKTDNNTEYPILEYPMNVFNGTTYDDVEIQAGSRIRLYFKFQRLGGRGGCEQRVYVLDETLTATNNYANMYDWWIGDNVQSILNNGVQDVGESSCDIENEFFSTLASSTTDIDTDFCKNNYRFYRNPGNNKLSLLISGAKRCDGYLNIGERESSITAEVFVTTANNLLVFETKPADSLPDLFYEGSQTFPITNGFHVGNEQTQTASVPAIVNTDFANCFSFGNGVESYKIQDSAAGRKFYLGNRVMAVSSQEYKEANRYSDVTYSGIYNNESNVNKLNEFNLGLLNFKKLEQSFGAIKVLDGRQADVLVLQEDKISYVLAGKNLLSDAAGGGTISSIPEVLGTQIPRIENYGISHNPESYVKYGPHKFFTDAKRNAVIHLAGTSASSEQLEVISAKGMNVWFKDMFNSMFSTQKLGGYDPSSDEYVLSSNNTEVLLDDVCSDCGQNYTVTVEAGSPITICVNVGDNIGTSVITYEPISDGAEFSITIDYDGEVESTGDVTTAGTIQFDRNKKGVSTASITIASASASSIIDLNIGCASSPRITVVEVCLSSNFQAGEFAINQYRYISSGVPYPIISNSVELASGVASPLVSRFNSFNGQQGDSAIPINGSTVRVSVLESIVGNSFEFDPAMHKLKYLRTNTAYGNNSADILSLVAAATNLAITSTPNHHYGDFVMPSSGSYLYLIWDFRHSEEVTLCKSTASPEDACCNC